MRFVNAATVERVYGNIDARRRAHDQRQWEKEEKKKSKRKPGMGKIFKAFLLLVKEGKIDIKKYEKVLLLEDKTE